MSRRFRIVTMHPDTLLGEAESEPAIGELLSSLNGIGGASSSEVAGPDRDRPSFLLVATGGSERVIMDWWSEHGGSPPDQELRLIAHPGNNSLPAALEVLARLQQDGTPGRIFYLRDPRHTDGLREIDDAVRDLEVRQRLERARIGVIGAPSDWLVASMPDAATVKSAWGPTLVPLEMDELAKGLESVADHHIEPYVKELEEGASR